MSQPRHAYLAHHLRPPGARIAATAQAAYVLRRARGERREALCAPERPALPDALWKVLRQLGLRLVDRPGPRVAVAIHWTLATTTPPFPIPGAVNGGCVDIRKVRVDAAMRAVVGYGTAVDPTRVSGPVVRKSDDNARHDGTIVQAPVARPAATAVHQRLVDTEVSPGTLEDLRTVVVAGAIPLVYVKRRPSGDRFGHGPSRAWIAPPAAVMDLSEQAAVLDVCADVGLDVGEVDVLRDRKDGRLHVVDVNRTPWDPPRTLGAAEARRAIATMAEAFAGAYLAG